MVQLARWHGELFEELCLLLHATAAAGAGAARAYSRAAVGLAMSVAAGVTAAAVGM